MIKCIALDNITYKDKWYKIGSPIDIDDGDINKLEKIGAIRRLGTIPEVKVKINVIKNPIKAYKTSDDVIKEFEDEKEEPKKIKRKYNKRQRSFMKRR